MARWRWDRAAAITRIRFARHAVQATDTRCLLVQTACIPYRSEEAKVGEKRSCVDGRRPQGPKPGSEQGVASSSKTRVGHCFCFMTMRRGPRCEPTPQSPLLPSRHAVPHAGPLDPSRQRTIEEQGASEPAAVAIGGNEGGMCSAGDHPDVHVPAVIR